MIIGLYANETAEGENEMEMIRGRWFEQYINSPEDKKNYDYLMRGRMHMHHEFAKEYCEKYDVPDLTKEEKKNIDNYWAQYGIKIEDYSYHRMYYFVTDIHDPKFIPDYIAGHIVYSFYNDHAYEYTWRDKNMFDRLLPKVPFPKTFAKRIRNRLYVGDKCFHNYGENEIAERIYGCLTACSVDEIVIKPARQSGFGRSVKKYTINSINDIIVAISEWNGNSDWIIQECISQHPILALLNESSSNMLRICSWRHDNDVEILFAAARIGVTGSFTDVSFINGREQVRVLGITKEGYFKTKILDQDGFFVRSFDSNVKVPAWNEIVDIIKHNHLPMDNFDIIGWDFTVDENEKPICFEWNIQWPGTVLYQYVNGPLWGDFTEEILTFLKDYKNQKNYVPCYLQR